MAAQMTEAEAKEATQEGLSAGAQVLPLPGGFYLFSVRAASPQLAPGAAHITLPALHVTVAPSTDPGKVEFLSGNKSQSTWLFAPGDMLIARVSQPGAHLVLTSLRAPQGASLDLRIERLEGRDERLAIPVATVDAPAGQTGSAPGEPGQALRLQIGAHVRARGDMSFDGSAWAGRVAPGLWLEAFSVTPLEVLTAADIEYKGLTASGFETPWLSGASACGTRGMGVPLVGFAVRLTPGPVTAGYDCQYSGHFKNAGGVGPLRNGTPCRSTIANDPLEGIQIRIVRKEAGATPPVPAPSSTAGEAPLKSRGPQFSKFREEADPAPAASKTAEALKAKPARPTPAARKPAKADEKSGGGER
jgi:hypothetical protein